MAVEITYEQARNQVQVSELKPYEDQKNKSEKMVHTHGYNTRRWNIRK